MITRLGTVGMSIDVILREAKALTTRGHRIVAVKIRTGLSGNKMKGRHTCAAITTREVSVAPAIDVPTAGQSAEGERETERRPRRPRRRPPPSPALRFMGGAATADITIRSEEGQNTWSGLLPYIFANDDDGHDISPTDHNSLPVCDGQCIPTS